MSYSKVEIQRQRLSALQSFVSAVTENGDVILPSEEMFESLFRPLARKFDFEVFRRFDRELRDDVTLKAITQAIRDLNRSGERVSVAKISKLVKMNHWSCRQLMVKYGLFDVKTKKVINWFDDWRLFDRNDPGF